MTKAAHGDEAAAVTNAVLGNILGVFITPSLIFAFVGTSAGGSMDYRKVFGDLAITVVAPVIVGQLILGFFPSFVAALGRKVNLSIVNSCLLLALVWSVFCDTFAEKLGSATDPGSLVGIIFLDLGLFLSFSTIAFLVSRIKWLAFNRKETVAIVMCAATKTVALGIPIIQIIYGGSPNIGLLSTPLLIYHAEQLVVGAVMVGIFKNWVDKGEAERERQLKVREAENTEESMEPLEIRVA
ncbi:hypothetical protein HK104_008156 [Borealophlyctis nickersoniae]|nr:hypothetical protein HK104_008156 [Borealophlyctis nickersoniae]